MEFNMPMLLLALTLSIIYKYLNLYHVSYGLAITNAMRSISYMIRNSCPWHCNTGRVVGGDSYYYYQHSSPKKRLSFLYKKLSCVPIKWKENVQIIVSQIYPLCIGIGLIDCEGTFEWYHVFVGTSTATYYTSDPPVLRHDFHLCSLTDVILVVDIHGRDS